MITTQETAIATFNRHEGEFAEVKNPSYVYPPVEYYPLAARLKRVPVLKAALMDMDGTTTTTEILCIYALESMVRQMSGLVTKEQWEGLDHHADLAHIIGNSTTKHVEYLIGKYNHLLKPTIALSTFLRSAYWTLQKGQDPQRQAEVRQNLRKWNMAAALQQIQQQVPENMIIENFGSVISNPSFADFVSMGIDIYYEIYHRILLMLRDGKGSEVGMKVFGNVDSDENLISPMPGIPVLIPLLKGWLGDEAHLLAPLIISEYEKFIEKALDDAQRQTVTRTLTRMGKEFERNPVKLALVTSSIFYEADIIIQEVLGVMTKVIETSPLSEVRKEKIIEAYKDYHRVYDAFVTATDSSEIRLKPHRDLYSIALHKAGIMPSDFDKVIGFEDSQSGTVAMRAAGIGCCIAVPFAQTTGRKLEVRSPMSEVVRRPKTEDGRPETGDGQYDF